MQYFDNTFISWDEPAVHTGQLDYKIALVGNLKEAFQKKSDEPPDAGSEFDKRETIEAIGSALESRGHRVATPGSDSGDRQCSFHLHPDLERLDGCRGHDYSNSFL